jgi:hypothetical protein
MLITVQKSSVRAHHHHTITETHRGREGVLLSLLVMMMVMGVMVQQVGSSSVATGQRG